jgi:hypothetical protein
MGSECGVEGGSLGVKQADCDPPLWTGFCASLVSSSLPRSRHCLGLQPAAGVNLWRVCNPEKERPSCDRAGPGAQEWAGLRCQNEEGACI